jgi:hypothetical protein
MAEKMTAQQIIAVLLMNQGMALHNASSVIGASEIFELERRDLAYRSVTSQTWHYSKLTHSGVELARKFLNTELPKRIGAPE